MIFLPVWITSGLLIFLLQGTQGLAHAGQARSITELCLSLSNRIFGVHMGLVCQPVFILSIPGKACMEYVDDTL